MAPTSRDAGEDPVPSQLWPADDIPAPRLLDVLTQFAHFLEQIGYKKTLSALTKEASAKSSLSLDVAAWAASIEAKSAVPFLSLHEEWHEGHDKFATLQAPTSTDDSDSEKDEAEGVLVDAEAEETSDDDSDEKEKSDADDSSDSSSSSGEEEEAPAKAGAKRKRMASPPSSSDTSSDSSSPDSGSTSSHESDLPPARKIRKRSTSKAKKAAETKSKSKSSYSVSYSGSSSSDSSDSSSSESEDEKPAPTPVKKGKKSKKDKKPAPPPVKKEKKDKQSQPIKSELPSAKDTGSLSSATLEAESSPEKEEAPVSHVHPDRLKQVPQEASKPTTKKEIATQAKKQQIPFSRIPTDQKVDERFASNEYVSYDYADRAHRDLIVTKGKGFTKEKNKKKRGSYRGGTIDLTPKGIKFDD